MNPHTPFTAELVAFEQVAKDTGVFRFRISEGEVATFTPGQFFLLQVDEKTHRAYSAASSPGQLPEFDLLIKYLEGGAASEMLWQAQVGDAMHFRGPLGKFALKHPENKQLFIATGTGLAPIRAMMQDLAESASPPPMHLVFGVRHAANLFCVQEFAELHAADAKSFRYRLCLSRPEEGVELDFLEGRVTDYVRALPDAEFEDTEVSICGSRQMVVDIREILEQKGVDNSLINVESW